MNSGKLCPQDRSHIELMQCSALMVQSYRRAYQRQTLCKVIMTVETTHYCCIPDRSAVCLTFACLLFSCVPIKQLNTQLK